MESRVAHAFQRFDRAELRFCRYLNRSSGYAAVRGFFAAVSRLGELDIPSLVVVGDHDETDSRAGYDLLLAGLPRAEGFRFPDSAHLPSVEHPERFTARLREFLAAHGL